MLKNDLNPDKALMFRIVHLSNISLVLQNGCICDALGKGANYRQIGNPDLIQKRRNHPVKCPPGGVLSDYVPFYFTPFSPMLYNIKTGYNGVTKQAMDDIAILVTSIHTVAARKIPFVFTDRHAYLAIAQFFNKVADLGQIAWAALQAKNFTKSDIDRFDKYQAEALVYNHLPIDALHGIFCHSESARKAVQIEADKIGTNVKITTQPQWYL